MNVPRHFMLARDATVLVIIDFQERLFRAMDPQRKEECVRNTVHLITLATLLKLPIMLTEQYPQGLGTTIPPIWEALPPGIVPIEKLVFSAWWADGFAAHFRGLGGKAAILVGMESHVCVLGTALDMLREGISVHVSRDAVISRSRENWQTGLDLMDRAGAVVTSTETVIFQLLGRAGTEEFKTMAKLLR